MKVSGSKSLRSKGARKRPQVSSWSNLLRHACADFSAQVSAASAQSSGGGMGACHSADALRSYGAQVRRFAWLAAFFAVLRWPTRLSGSGRFRRVRRACGAEGGSERGCCDGQFGDEKVTLADLDFHDFGERRPCRFVELQCRLKGRSRIQLGKTFGRRMTRCASLTWRSFKGCS